MGGVVKGEKETRVAESQLHGEIIFADRSGAIPKDELRKVLGGKGAALAEMATELSLPVPPAFTIATGVCNRYLASGWPDGLDNEIASAMSELEDRTGRTFGDPENPLLVSVRSGASVSMPGMLDTVLNLGVNSNTMLGLQRAIDDRFALDCRRRFLESYA